MQRLGRPAIEAKYGNLFDMYAQITGEDPYEVPMRIYPAVHYTMGGLWVDYDLQSSIPGMFVIGEANFSDHGANRLGASALMQGLADGYFVLPATISDYLADGPFDKVDESHPAAVEAMQDVQSQVQKLLSINGTRSPASFHRELGQLMWDICGMERSEESLRKALDRIPEIRAGVLDQPEGVRRPATRSTRRWSTPAGSPTSSSSPSSCASTPCTAARAAAATSAPRARPRRARRCATTTNFAYVAAWEWTPENEPPVLHKEALEYEYVHLAQRSYK